MLTGTCAHAKVIESQLLLLCYKKQTVMKGQPLNFQVLPAIIITCPMRMTLYS